MADISFLLTSIATAFGIYLILALSYNLEYGFAGQPNLGKVFFFSIGAYVAGALTAHAIMALASVPNVEFFSGAAGDIRLRFAASRPFLILPLFLVSLALAAILGAGFGYLASYPGLRLRGDFLAIVLIAIGEVSRNFVFTYTPIAGGVDGLTGVPNPFIWIGDPRIATAVYAVLVLAAAFALYLYVNNLVNSPYGRLLKSVRDDELASNVLGKRTPFVKGQVLALASSMAAVAGALYAFYIQTIYANDFVPVVTFTVVTMVIVGGVSNNRGVVLGALVLTLLDRLSRPSFLALLGIDWRPPFDINYLRYLAVGLIMVLILMFKPEGLIPERPLVTPATEVIRAKAEASKGPGAPGGQAGK